VTRAPDVELLWWEGCPSTPRALSDVKSALAELGLDPERIQMTEIETDADASAARFRGSPTVLVDGEDIQPTGGDDEIGLNCRIYRRRDGRISPTPDPEDLRDALRRAMTRQETPR
jgi:hypothetical protein